MDMFMNYAGVCRLARSLKAETGPCQEELHLKQPVGHVALRTTSFQTRFTREHMQLSEGAQFLDFYRLN